MNSFDNSFDVASGEVNTVVVGYGRWGRQAHAHLIERAPGLRLHGIVSSNPEKRAQIVANHSCRAYGNLAQVLADDDVHLVVLATPNDTHRPMAIEALNAGKHVVTDKVMCLSLEQYNEMSEAARRNRRLLTVFQNRRLDGDFKTLQTAMSDGTLGTVRWIEMAWQGFGAWGGWRGEMAHGGGKFYDLGAHLVDQMQLLFPQTVESVYCRMHHDFEHTDVESECLIVITFEGGCTGVIDLSSRAAISKPRFYAHGDKATFSKTGLDPQEDALKDGDIDLARENPETYAHIKGADAETRLETQAGRWRDYYENIAAVLQKGATPIVTLDSARRTMAILDAALRSNAENQVVHNVIDSAQ